MTRMRDVNGMAMEGLGDGFEADRTLVDVKVLQVFAELWLVCTKGEGLFSIHSIGL